MSEQRDWHRLKHRVAEIRLRIAMLSALSHSLKVGFRQDQPRGPDGCWIGGAGQIVCTRIDKTGNARIDAKTELLVDVVKEAVSIIGKAVARLTVFKCTRRRQQCFVVSIFQASVDMGLSKASVLEIPSDTVWMVASASMSFYAMVEPNLLRSWQYGTLRQEVLS